MMSGVSGEVSGLSRVPTCMPTMWAESFSLTIPSAWVALLMMVLYLAALAVKVPVSFPLAVRLHLAPCWALGGLEVPPGATASHFTTLHHTSPDSPCPLHAPQPT